MSKDNGSHHIDPVRPAAVEPSGLRLIKSDTTTPPPQGSAPAVDLDAQWAREITRYKGQAPFAARLTLHRLKVTYKAMKLRKSRGKAEPIVTGDDFYDKPTLKKFCARVARETGESVATLYRHDAEVKGLIALLGEAVVESLATKKVAFDMELLVKLPAIKSRDTALEILRFRETKNGERAAMLAFQKAFEAQEKAAIKRTLAELTEGRPVETAAETDKLLYGYDAFSGLRTLPDNYIQSGGCSPPFYALRAYGHPIWFGGDPACQHDKAITHKPIRRVFEANREGSEYAEVGSYSCSTCHAWFGELGQEPTREIPGMDRVSGVDFYVEHMREIFHELLRTTRNDGTQWVEIADTYADDGNLMGVPWKVAFALQADGWILRAANIWRKPAGMHDHVEDRTAVNHSYVFMFAKTRDYYYDPIAMMVPAKGGTHTGHGPKMARAGSGNRNCGGRGGFMTATHDHSVSVRNARTCDPVHPEIWEIDTGKNKSPHTSTFPQALPERWFAATMSPHGACAKCGTPWRARYYQPRVGKTRSSTKYAKGTAAGGAARHRQALRAKGLEKKVPPPKFLAWEPACACKCPDRRPSVGIDIFAGTGQALVVLNRLGHHYVGIEINKDNEDYAKVELAKVEQEPHAGESSRGRKGNAK